MNHSIPRETSVTVTASELSSEADIGRIAYESWHKEFRNILLDWSQIGLASQNRWRRHAKTILAAAASAKGGSQ